MAEEPLQSTGTAEFLNVSEPRDRHLYKLEKELHDVREKTEASKG